MRQDPEEGEEGEAVGGVPADDEHHGAGVHGGRPHPHQGLHGGPLGEGFSESVYGRKHFSIQHVLYVYTTNLVLYVIPFLHLNS